jgi:hypothetical protein
VGSYFTCSKPDLVSVKMSAAGDDLDALRAMVTKQAGVVKSMKAEGKPQVSRKDVGGIREPCVGVPGRSDCRRIRPPRKSVRRIVRESWHNTAVSATTANLRTCISVTR